MVYILSSLSLVSTVSSFDLFPLEVATFILLNNWIFDAFAESLIYQVCEHFVFVPLLLISISDIVQYCSFCIVGTFMLTTS